MFLRRRAPPHACSRACCPGHTLLHWFCCYSVPPPANSPSDSVLGVGYLEAVVVADVIAEDDGIGATVVGTHDGSESFLPGSVPYLQFDLLVADANLPELKVRSYGG